MIESLDKETLPSSPPPPSHLGLMLGRGEDPTVSLMQNLAETEKPAFPCTFETHIWFKKPSLHRAASFLGGWEGVGGGRVGEPAPSLTWLSYVLL